MSEESIHVCECGRRYKIRKQKIAMRDKGERWETEGRWAERLHEAELVPTSASVRVAYKSAMQKPSMLSEEYAMEPRSFGGNYLYKTLSTKLTVGDVDKINAVKAEACTFLSFEWKVDSGCYVTEAARCLMSEGNQQCKLA